VIIANIENIENIMTNNIIKNFKAIKYKKVEIPIFVTSFKSV